ncbi:hypothetical protein E2C01_064817 [Portunus trituberculatus]|uniref:Uncharacterized protein n=1 Tax=Portunus trituberculatus TaxID=210409 RepID=A0A5B7HLV5_PORTR|nr:hypothetical protein [Portunus trituberculatus]
MTRGGAVRCGAGRGGCGEDDTWRELPKGNEASTAPTGASTCMIFCGGRSTDMSDSSHLQQKTCG